MERSRRINPCGASDHLYDSVSPFVKSATHSAFLPALPWGLCPQYDGPESALKVKQLLSPSQAALWGQREPPGSIQDEKGKESRDTGALICEILCNHLAAGRLWQKAGRAEAEQWRRKLRSGKGLRWVPWGHCGDYRKNNKAPRPLQWTNGIFVLCLLSVQGELFLCVCLAPFLVQ